MKITKYLHSCLLVEDRDKTILIDPGQYTYDAHVFHIGTLKALDYILITHEHFDHLYIPFVTELLQKFPKATIISNQSVKEILSKEHIYVETDGNGFILLEEVPHENIFDKEPPQNLKFILFDKLTTPGDSFHFSLTTDILAMPITAPWGSLLEAVGVIEELKPKVVIPIHDWHWKDDARKAFYKRLTDHFQKLGIDFKGVETGETIEV